MIIWKKVEAVLYVVIGLLDCAAIALSLLGPPDDRPRVRVVVRPIATPVVVPVRGVSP